MWSRTRAWRENGQSKIDTPPVLSSRRDDTSKISTKTTLAGTAASACCEPAVLANVRAKSGAQNMTACRTGAFRFAQADADPLLVASPSP